MRTQMALFLVAGLVVVGGRQGCGEATDEDGDGWTSEEDCNDGSVTVYPGAPELCGDGVDSSCDGAEAVCGDWEPVWDPAQFDVVYRVGPGEALTELDEVPWEALEPGTLVQIFPRETPYLAKWVLNTAGTEAAPVVVEGMVEEGRRPVIQGDGAVTRLALDYWNEDRSVIKVGGSSLPSEAVVPSWIYLQGLDIRAARPGYSFVDDAGKTRSYADNAAAVMIEEGEHITVSGCVLSDAGNGLFASAASTSVHVVGNYIYGNGNPASAYEHNVYTEALGIVFEYNYFGPLGPGCDGNNLKDRSAGTVIRYNWLTGGSRQLDLVESHDPRLVDDPSYRTTLVYGNVLVESVDGGNSQLIHYGGDGDDPSYYRNGWLYVYGNTMLSDRSGSTTLLRLSTDLSSADVRGNIVHAVAGEGALAILDNTGTAVVEENWLQSGWKVSHSSDATGTVLAADNVEGSDPGFVDRSMLDLALTAGSAAVDQGYTPASATGAWPASREYVRDFAGADKPGVGVRDLGAFERRP